MIVSLFFVACTSTLNSLTEYPFADDAIGCDSAEVEDTGDSGDTDAVDTDTDTAVEDSGDTATAPSCEFEVVTTGNGRITVANELQFSLSSSSPSGPSIPGYQELMRLNVTSLHPECPELEVTFIAMWVVATDNAETGWLAQAADGSGTGRNVDIYDLSMDGVYNVLMSSEMELVDEGGGWVGPQGNLVIPPGETHTIAVYMNTTGASSELDDAIQINLGGRVHLTGSEYPAYFETLDIVGNALVY